MRTGINDRLRSVLGMRVLGKIRKVKFFLNNYNIIFKLHFELIQSYFPYLKFMSNLKNNSINLKPCVEEVILKGLLQCF